MARLSQFTEKPIRWRLHMSMSGTTMHSLLYIATLDRVPVRVEIHTPFRRGEPQGKGIRRHFAICADPEDKTYRTEEELRMAVRRFKEARKRKET